VVRIRCRTSRCCELTVGRDLYIQATYEIQLLADSDPMSYFQICGRRPPLLSIYRAYELTGSGIHGQPYIGWDGDSSSAENTDWSGYCPHNVSFLPYSAMQATGPD
jgi:hypothetical protein